ncbi:hypothetical protein Noca_0616 [Nocardioides sp. JS614]|nr:hypothetical protein Noca_0616 [Nocardioides sp. JS614]
MTPGIVRGTLRHWLEVYGTGKKTAADGTLTSSPLQSTTTTTTSFGTRERDAGAEGRPARGVHDVVAHVASAHRGRSRRHAGRARCRPGS